MSTSRTQMANKAGGLSELKSRLFFVLGALVVYRVGAHIPVPGIDPKALQLMFEQQSGSILDMFNMFSGGALMRLSLFALGIMPYISASIIMQLMTVIIPPLFINKTFSLTTSGDGTSGVFLLTFHLISVTGLSPEPSSGSANMP